MSFKAYSRQTCIGIGLIVALCLQTVPAISMAAKGAELSALVIVTAAGPQPFTVELAESPAERAQGLMFREQLRPDRGMLFIYPRNMQINMWMKNTLIPLDMIFIDQDGRIKNIAENTKPLSLDTVSSEGRVRAVLEVPGGTTKRLGIKPGDRVSHATLDK